MFLPQGIIDQLLQKYAEKTVLTHDSNIKRIFRECQFGDYNIDRFSGDQILNYLKTLPYSSKMTCLNSVIRVLETQSAQSAQSAQDIYRAQYDIFLRQESQLHVIAVPTQKEMENRISWYEILNIRDRLENSIKGTKDRLKHLLMSLYTYIPPQRNDFIGMLVHESPTENYMTSDEFVFQKYKTKAKYNIRRIRIPQKLQDIIRAWIQCRDQIIQSPYLLTNPGNNEKMVKTYVNNLLSPLGIDMLRIIYISDIVTQFPNSVKAIAAEMMSHSVATQQLHYKKFGISE